MNKNHFYIMSDTIPIMPLPETIENWIPSEIRPHPGNDPIEVELFTISHEDLIVDTPTIQSIQTEIKRMYDENEIPKNYQFYYYVLFPLFHKVECKCNFARHHFYQLCHRHAIN